MPTDAKMKEAIENLKKVDNKVDYNSCCSRRNYVYLSSESSGGDSIKNFLEWVRDDETTGTVLHLHNQDH